MHDAPLYSLHLHLSIHTFSISAQAMGDYATEATELVETYGRSALSLVVGFNWNFTPQTSS
jgi:hypothetical protein